eukprot:CAMPEP_0174291500 /NCGR_PEP_ID=MMETSP0809-20121228/32264_1 /TAXON_ID=73025 ORGANISM="Eutreptiella gymnastica-like, Strain CCMP1594" /NCGR_SAMPLE_ID=MMETSP0809 /ASSEMBLY_ACC=CAM_ASM_000658 /LENGTH=61 /DNA_ID=CAMNT_0015390853 /DNA_START=411 /DNA_END=593 /DNA_ORIENTATION=-
MGRAWQSGVAAGTSRPLSQGSCDAHPSEDATGSTNQAAAPGSHPGNAPFKSLGGVMGGMKW